MIDLNRTYRIIAVGLALLMFTSSVGFAVDIHYCQGHVKSLSFFGNAKNCHEMSAMANCPHHKMMTKAKPGCAEDDKNCCDNKTLHFQSDQDQQIQAIDVLKDVQLKQFVLAFVSSFFLDNLISESDLPSFTKYRPPLISRDIPVLNQSFLL